MKQPGDPVGSAMEYMPGNGVYEENGELFAGICGELKEDNQKCQRNMFQMSRKCIKLMILSKPLS